MPQASTIAQTLRTATSRPIPTRRLVPRAISIATRTPLRPARPTATSTRTSRVDPAPSRQRSLSSMASDEAYMAFLNKANKDADDARASAAAANPERRTPESPFKALDEGGQVPRVILDAIGGALYVSDADEPFDGVCLRWRGGGGLPDEEEFARLIQHWDAPHAEIEIMDPAEWDRHEQYGGIVAAVSEATRGNDVRVYRVPRDKRSRVEYWVVSRDDSTGSIVGVKALGVES